MAPIIEAGPEDDGSVDPWTKKDNEKKERLDKQKKQYVTRKLKSFQLPVCMYFCVCVHVQHSLDKQNKQRFSWDMYVCECADMYSNACVVDMVPCRMY
jgi:hypothetical protein